MAWIDFIICLFLGVLGVHKFKEKKIGMGLLYLFTGGLFGFGWLIDCIKYAAKAIKAQANATTYDNICGTEDQPIHDVSNTPSPKRIGLWILTVVLIIIALGFLPSFSSLLALAGAALSIPIEQWQHKLSKYIKGTYKTIAIIALVILTLATAPSSEPNDSSLPINTIPISETTECTDYIGESTSATAPNTATNPVETTAINVTESATPPTNVPTTIPTTVPTTAPTTAPTTEPPHIHSFSAATCTAPKTCSCGATEGSASGHNWNGATFTSPKTCSVCGVTEGSATGHNYANGSCNSCGHSDPNYVSQTLVWIPTKGGTKYHTHSGCSNMDEPRQVTEEEAEALGFTPCKRCH